MKQKGQESTTLQVGRWLGQAITNLLSETEVNNLDLVVPIPTHWLRRFTRSANIAALLADGIKRELDLPCYERLLVQNRRTDKQGTLSRRQRFQNVKNCFALNRGYSVDGRNVLLVDDVTTSGATANEATKLLLQSGAHSVYLAVVARGMGSY